ncbi:MAG TPA: zinc ribbon domain-containing protein [Vicinamibacteria bacterium]|nr:zinc ribbon domain-containing protein [Vicinamibacteria bacterium]
MYSWDSDTSGWYGGGRYAYSSKGEEERDEAARRAALAGGRTYEHRGGPIEAMVDPTKQVRSESKNPLVVAVDVTGSMAGWPFEIFDRLPLLYNTLAQYREDLEILFAAVGDAGVDRWPLQVTSFAKGYDLEQQLGALWGEGGGGDAPESYGLFAHWLSTHVAVPKAEEPPFLIVFGDAPMHETVPKDQVRRWLGDSVKEVDAVATWQQLGRKWNTWFLRRPTGRKGDEVHQQWAKAVGEKKILTIDDEQRAVDYAMGIVARAWGHFEDFKNNMRARHPEDKVEKLSAPIAMMCPRCGGPIPTDAAGLFKCGYCGATLKI